jgi:hypothetical protein
LLLPRNLAVLATGGVYYKIVDNGASSTTVTSTTGTLLPANWVETQVTPGQRVNATVPADAPRYQLNVIELSN